MHEMECEYLKKIQYCWNNLELRNIKEFLADNVKYRTDWAVNSIKGKSDVLDFIEAKFKKIRTEKEKNLIHLHTNLGYQIKNNMKPCLIISQVIDNELIQLIIQIEIKKKRISDIKLSSVPDLKEVNLED